MARKTNTKRKQWPPRKARLKGLIEEAIVDAYGESEQRTAFYTMLDDHLDTPLDTQILGAAAIVERIDMTGDEQIVAICRRGRLRQTIPILDLSAAERSAGGCRVDRGIPPLGDRRVIQPGPFAPRAHHE